MAQRWIPSAKFGSGLITKINKLVDYWLLYWSFISCEVCKASFDNGTDDTITDNEINI